MKVAGTIALMLLAEAAHGQTGRPYFTADRVLPFDSARSTPLSPGMILSIYGDDLGPEQSCQGWADEHHTETPNPAVPRQGLMNRLIYPTELCGVQVFIAEEPAGLLYVQAKQINFKVPQNVPLEGKGELKVVFQNQANTPVVVPLGMEKPKLTVEGVARVGSPLWIDVDMPYGWGSVVYPVSEEPNDFGCSRFEVRHNGVALLPIRLALGTFFMRRGNFCSNGMTFAGHPPMHAGRLPLHLMYRFDKPGVYEVRYTRLSMSDSEAPIRSEWKSIQVLAPQPAPGRAQSQTDPAEILSDSLPSVLGFSDAAGLSIVSGYLYHPDAHVRRYAAASLGYWDKKEVADQIARLIRAKGPSDVMVRRDISLTPDLLDSMLPYLESENPVLSHGSIFAIAGILAKEHDALPAGVEAYAERALVAAIEKAVQTAGEQTVNSLVVALGQLHGEASRNALWDFIELRVAFGQSLIAITWRKDTRDLALLGPMLESPVTGDPLSGEFSSLPYALSRAYGAAAVPYLESAMKNSEYVSVQTNCARELILLGRPAGFAFVAQAIELHRSYRWDMILFLRGQFPELQDSGEDAIAAFAKHRVDPNVRP